MTTKKYGSDAYSNVYAESIPTPKGRFAWPSLVTPRPPKAGKPGGPRYEISLVLEKDDPKVKSFVKMLQAESKGMIEFFNKDFKPKRAFDADEVYMFDGDAQDPESYPYYQNCWVLLARHPKQPLVVDDAKGQIDPSFIKGGMIGKLMVTPMLTSGGLRFRVDVVQFIKDDDIRFAGGTKSVSDLLSKLEDESGESAAEEASDDEDTEEAPEAEPEEEQKAIGNKPKKLKAADVEAAKAEIAQKGKKAALARL